MSSWSTLSALEIILSVALMFPRTSLSQTPAQPGRLNITSTPAGAQITINGEFMSQRTPANFVVAPGNYTVSTVGQPGKSACQSQTFSVPTSTAVGIECSEGAWKRTE
jgi:hypothetical protein